MDLSDEILGNPRKFVDLSEQIHRIVGKILGIPMGEFVRNFGQVFAVLFEVLLLQFQEELHHFAGWEGGGKGYKNRGQNFVNNLAFLNSMFEKDFPTIDQKSFRNPCP